MLRSNDVYWNLSRSAWLWQGLPVSAGVCGDGACREL